MTRTLKGISILNCDAEKEIKISLYTDDTTLLLPGKEEALRQAIGIFNKFRISSGLTLNLSKCEVLTNRIFKKLKCSLMQRAKS